MIKRAIFVVIGLILVVFLYYLSGYGYVQIKTDGDSISILTLNSGATEDSIIINDYKGEKILVRNNTYQIFARDEKGGLFTVAESPRFFQTKEVSATLKKERDRGFTSTGVKSCVYQFSGAVLSSPCGSKLSEVVTHVPGSNNSPPHTLPIKTEVPGYIEGYFSSEGSGYFLVWTPGYHAIYTYSNGSFKRVKYLNDLPMETFLTSNDTTLPALLTAPESPNLYTLNPDLSVSSSPVQNIHKDTPIKSAIQQDKTSAIIYSSNTSQGIDFTEADGIHLRSEGLEAENSAPDYIHIKNSSQKVFEYTDAQSVIGCGQPFICVIRESGTTIINTDTFQEVHTIYGTIDAEYLNNEVVLTFGRYVVAYSIESGLGTIIYSYPDGFNACGTTTLSGRLLVCVSDAYETKHTLTIRSEPVDDPPIDYILAELQKNPSINSASVYRQNVYISPDLGDLVYQSDTGSFEYDPSHVRKVKKSIDEILSNTNLEEQGYRIVNPLMD